MALVIDKFRNASSSSSKRTSQWLYEKMVEVIEIHQLEENTQSVDKNLSQMGTKVDAAPNKPGKGDKNPSLTSLRSLTSPTNLQRLTKGLRKLMLQLLRVRVRRVTRAKAIRVKVIRDSPHLRVFLQRRKRNGLVCIMPTTVATGGGKG